MRLPVALGGPRRNPMATRRGARVGASWRSTLWQQFDAPVWAPWDVRGLLRLAASARGGTGSTSLSARRLSQPDARSTATGCSQQDRLPAASGSHGVRRSLLRHALDVKDCPRSWRVAFCATARPPGARWSARHDASKEITPWPNASPARSPACAQ